MSKIEWTEKTWNPIVGCSKVSEGCRNCYAEKMANRHVHNLMTKNMYDGTIENGLWSGKVNLNLKALLQPLKRKKPTVYFVNSMSDLFHENVPDDWIDRLFSIMMACQYLEKDHTFQILTKRPERMQDYFSPGEEILLKRWAEAGNKLIRLDNPNFCFPESIAAYCAAIWSVDGKVTNQWKLWSQPENLFPLKNVWIGASVEDEKTAMARIPVLMSIPASIRFISVEPLLGPIKFFDHWIERACNSIDYFQRTGGNPLAGERLDWVIVGGESGPGARPMHPDWVRCLQYQCQKAGVPFFFKQWGEWGHTAIDCETGNPAFRIYESKQQWVAKDWVNKGDICLSRDGKILECGGDFDQCEYPVAILRKIGKKAAGRLLDGRIYDEMPEIKR